MEERAFKAAQQLTTEALLFPAKNAALPAILALTKVPFTAFLAYRITTNSKAFVIRLAQAATSLM